MPSDKANALERLNEALGKAIEYHTMEYNMTYQEIIGLLEIIKSDLIEDMYIQEANQEEEDEAEGMD